MPRAILEGEASAQGHKLAHGQRQGRNSTQITCAVVWTAIFSGCVASSFRNPDRSYEYISGGVYIALGINSTRTVLNPSIYISAVIR